MPKKKSNSRDIVKRTLGLKDNKHKTVLKDFTTKRSYCNEKGCKFYGQLAEQGVCYTIVDKELSAYFKAMMDSAERVLESHRKYNYKNLTQKQIIKRMKSEVVCHFMNHISSLNELVWLRGEYAKLRGKLGKQK